MIQSESSKKSTTLSDQISGLPNIDCADLLAHEANHRIKNSLQLVAAMLHLQAQQSRDLPILREALIQASHRVRTVAQLHGRLHRSIGGEQNAGEYLHDICSSLSHSLGMSTPTSVVVEAPYVLVQPDRLLRIGLIVTELITNAMKYGTPPLGTCEIKVVLTTMPDGTLSLHVSDNGPGIPDSILRRSTNGLGLYLVHQLTRTIGGRLEIDNAPPGARFTIRFAADSSSCHR